MICAFQTLSLFLVFLLVQNAFLISSIFMQSSFLFYSDHSRWQHLRSEPPSSGSKLCRDIYCSYCLPTACIHIFSLTTLLEGLHILYILQNVAQCLRNWHASGYPLNLLNWSLNLTEDGNHFASKILFNAYLYNATNHVILAKEM